MPTIIPITSILGYKQWEDWIFQPAATGMAHEALEVIGEGIVEVDLATSNTLSPTATYSNGTAGVGATLTGSSNGALSVDSTAVSVGQRILVKNYSGAGTNFFWNGRYVVTDAGSAGTPYILTRATDCDAAADFVGYVRALFGNTNTGKYFGFTLPVDVVGTSSVQLTEWTNRWKATGLPPGKTIHLLTGKISGAAEVAGIYNVSLLASDTSGGTYSTALTFPIAIEPTVDDIHGGASLSIDLQTGVVSTAGTISIKEDDDRIFYIRLSSRGTVVDRGDLTSLKIGLKEFETEGIAQLAGGLATDSSPATIGKIGTGTGTTYLAWGKFDAEALAAVLANYEGDAGTSFVALAEVEWVEPNDTDVGPATLTRTSATFPIEIVRDLIV